MGAKHQNLELHSPLMVKESVKIVWISGSSLGQQRDLKWQTDNIDFIDTGHSWTALY